MLQRILASCILISLLSACGGGGSGGATNGNTRPALPTLSQDTVPPGSRLDLRSSNLFPAAAGDNWVYDHIENNVASGSPYTRSVVTGAGLDVVISESFNGSTDSSTYRRSSDGIVLVAPFAGSAPAVASQFIGDALEYAEPFYAVGGVRSMVRQGDWGADEDGDGVRESYRLEFSQELVGLETMNIGNAAVSGVAHFRNVIRLTLQPSNLTAPIVTVVGTEDAWWAPGIGLVRAERSTVDGSGAALEPAYTLILRSGNVAGQPIFAAPGIDGSLIRVPLAHNALVFDRTRNRFLASIPGSVVGQGNSIASIDAGSGSISYSAAVGSEPGALALSADGSALFVGLNGTGEVLKLRLPDLVELWRVRLPVANFFGQLFAEKISVSPLDADAVAVSTYRAGVSPRHGGVALIRAGVLQPQMTQDHTGSNLIVFDASGQFVYGFNNETSEFGLRRIAVQSGGLQEQQVVTASANFATRTLDWADGRLVLDKAVYRAPDLALLGQINVDGGGCRPHAVPNRLVCAFTPQFSNNNGAALATVDATSFVVLATPYFQRGSINASLTEIVPGATGQVALRMATASFAGVADAVWLFNSDSLR